jgi:hypothetical protein
MTREDALKLATKIIWIVRDEPQDTRKQVADVLAATVEEEQEACALVAENAGGFGNVRVRSIELAEMIARDIRERKGKP